MPSHLKTRKDFLAAAKAPYQARGGVVVQARAREDDSAAGVANDAIRTGFTATKKIGNAVTRNRAKRRLREAARALIPVHGLPGHDYVLIARAATPHQDWQGLLDDVKAALIRLSRANGGQTRPTKTNGSPGSPQEKTVR